MSKLFNVSNHHAQYSDLTSQHWHQKSESFAGGDNLMTALDRNWAIEKCTLMTHWYAGMRSVRVYEFILVKDGDVIVMPVLDNPYVERFIIDEGVDLTEEAETLA